MWMLPFSAIQPSVVHMQTNVPRNISLESRMKPYSAQPPDTHWYLTWLIFNPENGGETLLWNVSSQTWYYIPGYGNIHDYHCKNLKSYTVSYVVTHFFRWTYFFHCQGELNFYPNFRHYVVQKQSHTLHPASEYQYPLHQIKIYGPITMEMREI